MLVQDLLHSKLAQHVMDGEWAILCCVAVVLTASLICAACRRTAGYQVRQYQPFLVAQTDLDNLPSTSSSSSEQEGSSSSRGINPASAGMKAFNALAKYIFGGNSSSTKMAMTTPVFTSTDGTMQFVVQPKAEAAQQVRRFRVASLTTCCYAFIAFECFITFSGHC